MRKLGVIFVIGLVMLVFSASVTHASTSGTIRIGLVREFNNRDSINIASTHILAGHSSGGVFSALEALHSPGGFTARVSGGQVVLYSGATRVFTFVNQGAQIADAGGGVLRLGNYSYRGLIEFRANGGRVTAINVICKEDYLYGVLPSEMSYSFHINALKAQAIASRTFMTYRANAGTHREQGFDLCDSTHCQSYRGAGQEHANTTRAVNETSGLMLYYNNNIILAVYFASSGGSTDNSENVWHETRPYLRAVRTIAEHEPHEWIRSFTWAQINTALQSAGANIGTATGMTITGTSPYGRVQELTIQGTNGQWRLTREATRTFFSPVGGNLMSRNFYIAGAAAGGAGAVFVTDGRGVISGSIAEFFVRNALGERAVYAYDGHTRRRLDIASQPQPATNADGVTLNGRGWGHGIGMSQRGALGMAMAGYSYRDILLHYYTGVVIR